MHAQWTGICDLLEVGGNMSAGLLIEKKLAFHGNKMGGKDHCHVIHNTTGQIKARNSPERLSFSLVQFVLLFFIRDKDKK